MWIPSLQKDSRDVNIMIYLRPRLSGVAMSHVNTKSATDQVEKFHCGGREDLQQGTNQKTCPPPPQPLAPAPPSLARLLFVYMPPAHKNKKPTPRDNFAPPMSPHNPSPHPPSLTPPHHPPSLSLPLHDPIPSFPSQDLPFATPPHAHPCPQPPPARTHQRHLTSHTSRRSPTRHTAHREHSTRRTLGASCWGPQC